MEIYSLSVDALAEDDCFFENYEMMSDERKRKIDAFRFQKDKRLSLGAGILLDRYLKTRGLSEKAMRYTEKGNGKPCFLTVPEICFNISHSETEVIAAFSDRDVGCDIEWIHPVSSEISRRFYSHEEYDDLMAAPEAMRERLFFRYWTLKESYMKLTALGMEIPMSAFCIRLSGETIRVTSERTTENVSFYEFSEVPGYCAAACEKGEGTAPIWKRVTI